MNAIQEFSVPHVAHVRGEACSMYVITGLLWEITNWLCLYNVYMYLLMSPPQATFHTPFMSLGQSPEGCSSLLFPRIMGPAQVTANTHYILHATTAALYTSEYACTYNHVYVHVYTCHVNVCACTCTYMYIHVYNIMYNYSTCIYIMYMYI